MEPLKLIRINSSGPLVTSWQFFLLGQGHYEGTTDGIFDDEVREATIEFQKLHGLQPDGVVGNKTFGQAMILGFQGAIDTRTDKSGPDWPPPPNFKPLVGNEERQKV